RTQCRKTTRTYDPFGKVWTEAMGTDGEPETELTVMYTRDVFSNIVKVMADDGFEGHRVSCTSYDAEGIFPFAHKNPVGHLSFVKFDPGFGVQTAAVDPNHLVTRWAHDGFGRIMKEQRPDGTTTTSTLSRTKDGGAWNVKLRTKTDGGADETVQFDSLGRVVRHWSEGAVINGVPSPRILQEIVFDELGEHVARRSVPASELTPPADMRYDEYGYDALGRVIKHRAPWGGTTLYAYYGSTVQVQDPLGYRSLIQNDGLGRPVAITDNAGGLTSYAYGPFGGLWTVTDPGGAETTTERDAYGRGVTLTDPDRGKTTSHYNGFGLRTSSTDEQLRQIAYFHDPLGRLIARADNDGTTTWEWDTAPHGIGKIKTVTSPDG